ncbi:MAG: M23 family metallopeptidase [Brevundimonas sp.]
MNISRLLVQPGQRVRRGQVIARLGASGHVSAPQLHFHVSDALSLLDAESLPYRLEGVAVLGAYDSFEAFTRGGPWPQRPQADLSDSADLPSPNMVVMFPGEGG